MLFFIKCTNPQLLEWFLSNLSWISTCGIQVFTTSPFYGRNQNKSFKHVHSFSIEQLTKDPTLNTIWETFDFAWGDPAQNGDDVVLDADDSEADTGPTAPPLLSIEDGGVSDNESDGVPSTVPEQTQDIEGTLESDLGVGDEFPKVNDEVVDSMNVAPLLPDSCREDLTEPIFSYDHLSPNFDDESPTEVIQGSQQLEGDGDVPVETNQEVEDAPKDMDVEGLSGDLSEPPQPTASMPPPPPVDPTHLERKKEVKARLEVLRLGLLKFRIQKYSLKYPH